MEQPELLTQHDLDTEKGTSLKLADLYHDKLFTVVPHEHDLHLGILPQDQGFSSQYVFLWDTFRDLIHFDPEKWKKIEVKIPDHVKHTGLTRIPGNAYALKHVLNTWPMEAVNHAPLYVE